MLDHLTVSDAARQLAEQVGHPINPRTISTLLYQRVLRDDLCPIVGGRRLIPRTYLPAIRQVLVERGVVEVGDGN